MRSTYLLAALLTVAIPNALAQTVHIYPNLEHWDTVGVKRFETETFLGKECVVLRSGFISVKNAQLRDGIIEADISFPQQRGFPGIAFRMIDNKNFENFYVRPHQSGNPDAMQYTPVFNGNAGWQLYHGEGFSKDFQYRFNEWHHIKIDIHGLQAEIYIDDMQKPVMKVAELLNGWKSGKFGLISGGVPIRIANVQYTLTENHGPEPQPSPVPPTGTDGVVTEWKISNSLGRELFREVYTITPELKKKMKWTTQRSEPSGTINLSRFSAITESSNTIVASVVIESQSDQMKVVSFGFSDFVVVYLNDKALFAGSDNFLSRDYRFLGTVGYFDSLVLPLKKGSNELWFVISENFGGWGIKAKFDNMDGIRLR